VERPPTHSNGQQPRTRLRQALHTVIFEAETPLGQAFDVALLVSIIGSIVAVMLESVDAIEEAHGSALRKAEWIFTGLFTLEYGLRLFAVRRPWRYAVSFFGVVDLLAISPTYVSLLIPGTQSLLVIRALRLLRVFRVFKLGRFLAEANVLIVAVRASAAKIIVFLGTVLSIALIMGAVLYLVEGAAAGFTSIPKGMYWAIVTLTTVGYGDIAPETVPGQTIAAAIMIMGYSILAVPTGIVSVELAEAHRKSTVTTEACPTCGAEGHDVDARCCKSCGAYLHEEREPRS
jgi:voltage-gated potassium channel